MKLNWTCILAKPNKEIYYLVDSNLSKSLYEVNEDYTQSELSSNQFRLYIDYTSNARTKVREVQLFHGSYGSLIFAKRYPRGISLKSLATLIAKLETTIILEVL